MMLWGAQLVLAGLQVLNFLSSLLAIVSGRASNGAVASGFAGLGLLLGLGLVVPWWIGQAMVLTPVAAAGVVLFVLFDGLTKRGSPLASSRKPRNTREMLEWAEEHRFARFEAVQLSLLAVLAVLIAVGRSRDLGAWDDSVFGWLFVLCGTMTLVACLLGSTRGPSTWRWGQAGVGLVGVLVGCAIMASP
ncbi:MAG: hypothetical protein KTR31_04140 [Myxococcales bacterium]|nr:hypothetical protein [Myxococcales bacterium]